MATSDTATIYQYILDDVRRPDMEEIIKRRIQRAVLYFHRKDMWKRDLIEQIYEFSSSAGPTTSPKGGDSLFLTSIPAAYQVGHIQQIDISVFSRLRFFQYIRKWQADKYDPDTGSLGTFADGDLIERAPDSMFDGYGADVDNVFYRNSSTVRVKSSTPLSQLAIGWFQDPIIVPYESLCSWIADDYPSLIAARVKKTVFSDIGKMEERNTAQKEEEEELLNLYANNIRVAMR